jgi:mutator protein MutT
LEGFWEFPGGKREPGESLEECLARELKEELDICITPPTPFHVITHDYPDKSVELHFFLCSIRGGSPQALDCDDWRWVSAEDLARYTFPPADQPVILLVQQYAKQKASGMTS